MKLLALVVCTLVVLHVAAAAPFRYNLTTPYIWMFTSAKYVAMTNGNHDVTLVLNVATGELRSKVTVDCRDTVNHCATVAINDDNDMIYWSASNGMNAYSIAKQATMWVLSSYMLAYGPRYDDGVLYFTHGGNLYAVDAVNGSIKWSYKTNYCWGQPVVTPHAIIVGDNQHGLLAVNKADGTLKWVNAEATPSLDGSKLYIESRGADDRSIFVLTKLMKIAHVNSDSGKTVSMSERLVVTDVNPKAFAVTHCGVFAYNGTGIVSINAADGKSVQFVPAGVYTEQHFLLPTSAYNTYLDTVVGNGQVAKYSIASGTLNNTFSLPSTTKVLQLERVGESILFMTNAPALFSVDAE